MSEKKDKEQAPPVEPQLVSPAKPPVQPTVHFQQINLTNVQPGMFLPADELQALAVIDPAFPKRIMDQVERTLEHNREMQREQLAQQRFVAESQGRANELNADAQKLHMRRLRRTDWMGYSLIAAVVASGIWILWEYHDATLLKVFFGGVAAIATAVFAKHKFAGKDDQK